jgi:Mn-dependent DtxR family transcriptional regulator
MVLPEFGFPAKAILIRLPLLSKKSGTVRSIDVATEMNFTKASISAAMKRLREERYITVKKDGPPPDQSGV